MEDKDRTNIILTGFMATGKTTVGRTLASQLGYEFVDTDELIETRIGMTVAEFFKEKGEAAFRKMESDLAKELADRRGLVISTGGRFMLDPDNASALGRTGRVFCLVATPEEILQRAEGDSHVRPLLQVPNPLENIVELLQQRKEGYGQFLQLVTSEKTPETLAGDLAGILVGGADVRLPIAAPHDRYEFIVGGGLLPFLSHLAGIDGPIAIITDDNVGPLYGKSCGSVDVVVTVPPGRQNKNLATAQSIYERLLGADFDRTGTIIALGGTVITELAGFIAATYMRGVDCVQCPTSLLAMVDTSIGGKTGIDLPHAKNLVGVFKQPKTVIADIATLQSLPPRAFASGMAEVIKHSLIADSDLLHKIESGNWIQITGGIYQQPSELQALVAQAIQVKINIVQEDPFDHGRRAVLNFGHTFANAIERLSHHRISHGEAVAMGIVAATNLSAHLGHCPADLQERIEAVMASAGLQTRIPAELASDQLLLAMRSDKKKQAGKLRYVLIKDVGDVFITDQVPEEAVLSALADLKS
ncbi:MAG: 3-dehydroquinate synthase [bacterium]|nr:MAG: 3-dehydroquinate synthase [bacterium]